LSFGKTPQKLNIFDGDSDGDSALAGLRHRVQESGERVVGLPLLKAATAGVIG
jgi:hypothetical protein